MTEFLDPNGPGGNLLNFGFSTMAASSQPGVTLGGALGQGYQGMNAAALQGAQTQNIRAETQSKQLQNQMIPLQLQFMKMRMAAAQQDADEDNDTSPAKNTGGTPWVTPLGSSSTNKQPTSYPTDPDNSKSTSNPSYMSMVPAVFKTAQNVGVEPALLHGVYMTESSGATNVPNGDGGKAIGSMQLHAGAAKDAGGGDRNDPTENLKMGATYLKQNIDKYGDPVTGILAYNWGPGNVDKWKAAGSDPSQIPQPQKDYVNKVLNSAIQVGYTPPQPMGSTSEPQRNLGQGVAPAAQSSLNLPPELQQTVKRLKRERNLTFDPAEQSKIDTQIAAIYQNTPGYKQEQKSAEERGTNIVNTEKGVIGIDSRIVNSMKTLDEMATLVPAKGQAQYGEHIGVPLSRAFNTDMAANQTVFERKNANLFTQELGPLMQTIQGTKGSIPLINAIKEASQIPTYGSEKETLAAIANLKEQLKIYQDNMHNAVALTKGEPITDTSNVVSDESDLAKYKNPKMIGQAYRSGELTKEQATKLLRKNHGMQ